MKILKISKRTKRNIIAEIELEGQHIENVSSDFINNKIELKYKAQSILNSNDIDANVEDLALGGSYANGTANADSDIDVEVYYTGSADEKDVWYFLVDKLEGLFGPYDIVVRKT